MVGTISCLALILIAGFIGFLFYRRNQLNNDLQDFYHQNNYVQRERLPVKNPFIYEDLNFITSLDGNLKPDLPYILILGTRTTGGGQDMIRHDYIGFYFPPHASLTDQWLGRWKQKVSERGDNWAQHSDVAKIDKNWGLMGAPEHLPIRALRINNGVLIAWNGLHLRHVIESRIKDVANSLLKA
jgi:hypothetical protein